MQDGRTREAMPRASIGLDMYVGINTQNASPLDRLSMFFESEGAYAALSCVATLLHDDKVNNESRELDEIARVFSALMERYPALRATRHRCEFFAVVGNRRSLALRQATPLALLGWLTEDEIRDSVDSGALSLVDIPSLKAQDAKARLAQTYRNAPKEREHQSLAY